MKARTAVILANERVLADPRPPNAPLTSASPSNIGMSFGGSSTWAAVIRLQCNKFNARRRHAAVARPMVDFLFVAEPLRRHLAHEPLAGVDAQLGALDVVGVQLFLHAVVLVRDLKDLLGHCGSSILLRACVLVAERLVLRQPPEDR